MAEKKIIVLSDGTGNSAAKVWRTNVWRVFELLDLTDPDQVAKYDDGVGSSSFKPLALLGGAFGWGLKRNVIDLYKFTCRNYKPGAKIYGFGFSRGAFTIRVLMALILHQGIVPYYSESDLHKRCTDAYRAYRAERFHSVLRIETVFRGLRDILIWLMNLVVRRAQYDKSQNIPVDAIEFIGLWDTVAAYGLPIDEMTRGISQWVWPLELPRRDLDPRVRRACHAVALDDERTTFHPVLWTEAGEKPAPPDENGQCWLKDERISQVWFPGMHSNVGGGYPDDALAYLPLYWVMQEAAARGLAFKAGPPKADPDAFLRVASARDKDGRLYDSRSGLGGYYRYGPRKIADLCHTVLSRRPGDSVEIAVPKIHECALARMRSDSNAYAPIGIPADYAVANFSGNIVPMAINPYETGPEAVARAVDQEKIWNLVWAKRIVYFATLAASFHLAAFWLFHNKRPEHEFSSSIRPVSDAVRFVETFLPRNVVRWWTDWYATNPEWFLGGILAVVVLIWVGSTLETTIGDSMRMIWNAQATNAALKGSIVHTAIFRLRTHPFYQASIITLRRHVLPFLSALVLVWVALTGANQVLFSVLDSTGLFCTETDIAQTTTLKPQEASQPILFKPNDACFPTKIRAVTGARYAFTFEVTTPWKDGPFQVTPKGFKSDEVPHWWNKGLMYSAILLRRDIFRRWFDVIARVGSKGVAEDFLDPSQQSAATYYGETATVRRDGELFVYVNDAVLPLPWIYGAFYANNEGEAQVTIKRLK